MATPAERAYAELIGAGEVLDAGALEPMDKFGSRAFTCELAIPQPNPGGLPASTKARITLPAQFPKSKVTVVLLDPAMRGFAHQDIRSGELCLTPHGYPFEAAERLRAYVESAKEWLTDAAHGRLLKAGQHWELPDFHTSRADTPPEVLGLEDAESFSSWAGRVGEFGEVDLAAHVHAAGIVPVRFTSRGATVHEPLVSEGFLDRRKSATGTWVLLESFVVARHRPARTFVELEEQCRELSVDVWRLVHRSLKRKPYKGYYFLLVGAPIPRVVDGSPESVHWQPIAFASSLVDRFRGRGKCSHGSKPERQDALRERLRGALQHAEIPWGNGTTYPPRRAERRGSLADEVKALRICVLGCGAIGSLVADHLARGGVRELTLFDNEVLDLENLSRHALGPAEVGKLKAPSLAMRLNGIHPGAHVRGYSMALPPRNIPTKKERPQWDLLRRADLVIDCTANDIVSAWVSHFGREHGKRVIQLFINAYATMLTLCISGKHAACAKVEQKLFADIRDARTGFAPEEHNPEVEELFPGAGCWQGTFPALGTDIAALVAVAMRNIETVTKLRPASAGLAVVLRRREFEPEKVAAGPMGSAIEVAWAANYR